MHHPIRRPTAFSLVELLVAIGIIVLLIGILIPVITSVRRSAWAADTKNTISQLSSAITRYYQDHNAYPGALAYPNPPTVYQADSTGKAASGTALNPQPTMTESMVMALIGGLEGEYSASGGVTLYFSPAALSSSRGPANLNPRNPKRLPAYLTASPDMLSDGKMGDHPHAAGMTDSVVPEFVDGWPLDERLPIIYLRARAGASGIISDEGNPGNYQYDLAYIKPYLRPADGLRGLGETDGTVTDTPDSNAVAYFMHPSTGTGSNATGTPREKDRFVLIAAGPDRIYGTSDDIVSWGDR